MLATLALVMVSLALLYFGGEWLIRGASTLGARLGMSPLVIGLTIVGFGTSAPELVVSLNAALSGANDISVGNVVGSNIANLTLILGLAALLQPCSVEARIVRIDAPIMIAASIALAAALYGGEASRLEGGLFVVALAAYTAFNFRTAPREPDPVQEEIVSAVPAEAGSTRTGALLVALGLVVLVAGGHLLVTSAVALATSLGVSQAVIGLTIVAVGTSLPEFATTVVASLRGQGDLAIGNVIGSNVFNVLGILGVTALVRPLQMGAVTWLDLGVMLAVAAVVAVFATTQRRLGRVEGAILLAAFVLYTGWRVAV